jgi:hypothetical protein
MASKKTRKSETQLRRDLRALRAARRQAQIDAGMLHAYRAATFPDARKVASKSACRGKVSVDD